MPRQTPFRVGVCYRDLAASSGSGFRAPSSRQKDEGTRRGGSACNNASWSCGGDGTAPVVRWIGNMFPPPLIAVAMLQDDHGGNVGATTARLGHGHTSADTKAELVTAGNGGHPDQLRYGARRLVRQSSCGGSAAASPLGEFYFAAADADSGTECAGPPSPTRCARRGKIETLRARRSDDRRRDSGNGLGGGRSDG